MSVLCNITHNAGNLSEYDSVVTDGGDLSAAAAAALAGSPCGLSCLIDDTTSIYGTKTLTAASQLRYRFHIDPNSLTMGAEEALDIIEVIMTGAPWVLHTCYLLRSGGSYLVGVAAILDSQAWVGVSAAISDAPHYVEVLLARAASAVSSDGQLTLWIDGTYKNHVVGMDNYDIWSIASLSFGCMGLDANTIGTLYLDELRANNDGSLIGPADSRWKWWEHSF